MPAQDQWFDVRFGRPDRPKAMAENLYIRQNGMIADSCRIPVVKLGILVRIKMVKLR